MIYSKNTVVVVITIAIIIIIIALALFLPPVSTPSAVRLTTLAGRAYWLRFPSDSPTEAEDPHRDYTSSHQHLNLRACLLLELRRRQPWTRCFPPSTRPPARPPARPLQLST